MKQNNNTIFNLISEKYNAANEHGLCSIRQKLVSILTVLIVLWLFFIWAHSMMPAAQSSRESHIVAAIIRPVLEPIAGRGNVTDHFVRKLAHFSEYDVLGILIGLRLLAAGRHSFYHWSYGLLIALAAAVADESIQLFSDGRGSQVTDVLIDTFGSLTGLMIVLLAAVILRGGIWLLTRDQQKGCRHGSL